VTASLATVGGVAGVLTLTSNAKGAAANVTLGASTGGYLGTSKLVQGSSVGFDAPPASTTGTVSITITQAATKALATGNTAMTTAATTTAGTGGGNLVINGVSILVTAGDSLATIVGNINASGAGVTALATAGTGAATGFTFSSNDKGAGPITIASSGAGTNTLLSDLGLAAAASTQATNNGVSTAASAAGKQAAGTYSTNGGTATGFSAGNGTTLVGGGLQIDTASLTAVGPLTTLNSFSFTNSSSALNLQIGANAGQTLTLGIEDMSATALGVSNLDVSSSAAINAAGTGTLALIDNAIATVSSQRATLGAYQNRLEHTISNLGVSQSNLTASESRIRDVDMAAEMVNFTKTGILQQAGQAILAQANQSGSGVMSLLR
jgi:flagellin